MKTAIDQLERIKKHLEDEIISYDNMNIESLKNLEYNKSLVNTIKKELQEIELAISTLKGNTNDSQSKKINRKR